MIHKQVKQDVTSAMKEGEKDRLLAARNLLSALTNELVSKKKRPSEMLDDEDAISVVRRLAKQRKDAIEQFREGNREDLVQAEEKELAYLEKFLPQAPPQEEIEKVIEAKKKELGITDKSGMGRLMGVVMKEMRGSADGTEVKKLVEKSLSS